MKPNRKKKAHMQLPQKMTKGKYLMTKGRIAQDFMMKKGIKSRAASKKPNNNHKKRAKGAEG
jgi:hypothetical protein